MCALRWKTMKFYIYKVYDFVLLHCVFVSLCLQISLDDWSISYIPFTHPKFTISCNLCPKKRFKVDANDPDFRSCHLHLPWCSRHQFSLRVLNNYVETQPIFMKTFQFRMNFSEIQSCCTMKFCRRILINTNMKLEFFLYFIFMDW